MIGTVNKILYIPSSKYNIIFLCFSQHLRFSYNVFIKHAPRMYKEILLSYKNDGVVKRIAS